MDKDIEGFDLKMVKILRRNSSQEASIKQCKFECEVLYRSGCRGFVFDNKTCFLKSIGGPLIQHKGTITYVINDHRVDLHQLGWRMGSNDRNKFIHSFSGRKSGRGGSNNPFNIFPNGRKGVVNIKMAENKYDNKAVTVVIAHRRILYQYFQEHIKKIVSLNRIIIGAISNAKNAERRMRIRATYAKTHNNVLFIICGKWNSFKSYLIENEYNKYGDMIWIDMDETKSSIPWKVQILFHAVYATGAKNYKYILKTQDNFFINVYNLEIELFQRQKNSVDYWGFVNFRSKAIRDVKSNYYISYGEFKNDVFPPYCSAFGGYVISKKFNSCLVHHLANGTYIKFEDVTIGILRQVRSEFLLPTRFTRTILLAAHMECESIQ